MYYDNLLPMSRKNPCSLCLSPLVSIDLSELLLDPSSVCLSRRALQSMCSLERRSGLRCGRMAQTELSFRQGLLRGTSLP